MKRFSILLFSVLAAAMGVLLLTACEPEAHLHNWSEWQTYEKATCTEAGVSARYCDCGEVNYGEINPSGHKPSGEFHSDGLRHWSDCTVCEEICEEAECSYAPTSGSNIYSKEYACKVCSTLSAYSGKFKFIGDSESYAIYSSTFQEDDLVIPESFNGKPVTSIGNFHGTFKTVKLPKTIVTIDSFSNTTSLERVELNEGLKSIGDRAFFGCTALKEITLPETVTSIGEAAFQGCTSLKEITVPEKVTAIGEAAFSGCTSLQRAKLPSRLQRIEADTFYKCSALAEINFPETLTFIGDSAFYECLRLENLSLPAKLESIGMTAFSNCTALYEVTVPQSLDETLAFVGNRPFDNTPWLSHQPKGLFYLGKHLIKYNGTMPAGTFVKDIRQDTISIVGGAFNNCTGLTGIIFPMSVQRIGQYAFQYCEDLKSIIVPSTVKRIEVNAFFPYNDITVYTDAPTRPNEWYVTQDDTQASYYPTTLFNCTLSEDKSYVISFDREAKSTIGSVVPVDPHRQGYTFGGWATEEGSTVAAYTSETVLTAPIGTKLYAIWIEDEIL